MTANTPAPVLSPCPYTVNSVKTFRGREGEGFNCKLLHNGRVVAEPIDSGDGGAMRLYFPDRAEEAAFRAFADNWNGKLPEPERFKFEVAEGWVNHAVDQVQTIKMLKRHSKTKTLYRLHGDKPGEYRAFGRPFTESIEQSLRTHHGDKLELVVNPASL